MASPSTVPPAAGEGDAERFGFGENWRAFLERVDDVRIAEAERSLEAHLGEGAVRGLRMLDLGCGSGLFSLAAIRLGAREVLSLDYDPASVATARELARRFAPGHDGWRIEVGDATDGEALAEAGSFDLVYSWGVLHHTGQLWRAMGNACDRVGAGGRLFVSVYNDQGGRSRLWRRVKRTYNRLPPPARTAFVVAVMGPREGLSLARWTLRGRPLAYVRTWTEYRRQRGMSRWHDLVDWVGGYPFEVAKPEEVFAFCSGRGLRLQALTTAGGGLGCNQFVFVREG